MSSVSSWSTAEASSLNRNPTTGPASTSLRAACRVISMTLASSTTPGSKTAYQKIRKLWKTAWWTLFARSPAWREEPKDVEKVIRDMAPLRRKTLQALRVWLSINKTTDNNSHLPSMAQPTVPVLQPPRMSATWTAAVSSRRQHSKCLTSEYEWKRNQATTAVSATGEGTDRGKGPPHHDDLFFLERLTHHKRWKITTQN